MVTTNYSTIFWTFYWYLEVAKAPQEDEGDLGEGGADNDCSSDYDPGKEQDGKSS